MHSSKHIARELIDALNRGVDAAKLTDAVTSTMLGSSQSAQLKHVLFYLKEYGEREKKENTCIIESATELTESEVAEIQKLIGASDVSVRTNVDPALQAGFRVKYRDVFVDKTLAARLKKLRDVVV